MSGCFGFVCLWLLVLLVFCCAVRLFGSICVVSCGLDFLGRWFVLGFGFVGFGL